MSSNHHLYILPDRKKHPFKNMEEDLLLLYRNPALDSILFRHYEWEIPCWTCGYSQKFQYVVECTGGSTTSIFRRATGGGIVPHFDDWTFTLLIGKGNSHYLVPPRNFYNIVHTLIAGILKEYFQIPAILHACQKDICNGAPPTECFISPVLSDVLHEDSGEKVAGAAIKKTREGILLQGSVQKKHLHAVDWIKFKEELIKGLSMAFEISSQPMEWPFANSETWKPYGERIHSKEWQGI